MTTYILWTGRFQPPHLGHLEILQRASRLWTEPFLVGIIWSGSHKVNASDVRFDPKHTKESNPFTLWERKKMFELSLDSIALKADLIYLPRADKNKLLWPQFLPSSYIRATTTKNNGDIQKAIRWKAAGDRVRILPILESLPCSASEIKNSVRRDESWQNFLHESTHEYFTSIDGPERLRKALV